MKALYKSLLAGAMVAPMMLATGCIEEEFPTSGATQEQLAASSKATEALLYAMPAYMNKFACVSEDQHYDYGYGSIMHYRDVMTADLAVVSTGYDWYSNWAQNSYMGPNYMRQQWVWTFFYKMVLTTNNMMSTIDLENANAAQKEYYGMGLAYRASTYLDMARMYEFLPNDAVSPINSDGKDVSGLTMPIVTEQTTEEESRDNPRATHEEAFTFIMSDLDKAEELLANVNGGASVLPTLAVVYGLKARAYMWNLDYPKAAEYARKAIASGSYSPVTKDQWLNTGSGFNEPNQAWMWYAQTVKEDDAVQTGIINWTSWMSPEAEYGYSAAGAVSMIGAELYNKMSDRDFRKLSFKAPEGGALAGQEPVINASYAAELPEYTGFKFRPAGGNTSDYNVGSASAYPLMRIEEMYLIEAEAIAHSNPAEGKSLLESFVKTYRYPTYSCKGSSEEEVVDEIFLQKRIEFWGEGITFFDYKRLNKSVTRAYNGTNFASATLFNTEGRPAWMNICLVNQEGDSNKAVKEYNNPDPSGCYTLIQM